LICVNPLRHTVDIRYVVMYIARAGKADFFGDRYVFSVTTIAPRRGTTTMKNEFFCCACGKWKPLADKVERGAGRRPECRPCVARAGARSLRAGETAARARSLRGNFLRWATHA
jgi:hypothetical protein